MKAELLEIDSSVCGRNVLAIHDLDSGADFTQFERDYIAAYDPMYVSCKVPLERVADTHVLESAGFHLIECQIRSSIKLRNPYDVSRFPYLFERVAAEKDLRDVLDIAGSTFVHDRFAMDPALDPSLSGKRYQECVAHSFRCPDESVYRLIEPESGRTVAFKTHRYVSNTEVLFLLGGVHTDFKKLGLGLINEYFEFNELIRRGVKRGITHISACNYPVFNLEIGNLGFRVLATFAVMRKIYPGSAVA